MGSVRASAVSGTFYPCERAKLTEEIEKYLAVVAAQKRSYPNSALRAVIAPHAGYIYSGSIAAHAYLPVRQAREQFTKVVVVGPAHREPTRGLAVSPAEIFETPFGKVKVDQGLRQRVCDLPGVKIDARPHLLEHSIEVHLPFLQITLGDFLLLPVLIGDSETDEVARFLQVVGQEPETLLVVSSDLSHFLSYEKAQAMDERTVAQILEFEIPQDWDQACGRLGISGLVSVAQKQNWQPHLLALANSGDTSGDRNRVVGYTSIGFWES